MEEKRFFSNSLVENYLTNLNNNLKNLPYDIRKQHIEEVKADLYNNALSLSRNDKAEDEVSKKVIGDFIPPQELAKEIQREYKHDFNKQHRTNNALMKYFTVFSIGCLGALSLPIVLGFLNITSSLPLVLFFLVSNIWLISSKSILWNETMLGYFKKMITFCKTILIALPLAFFSIRLAMLKELDNFSLYYMVIFLIVVLMYITLLSIFYKKKKDFMQGINV
ncbi:hypothetical protein [Rossellomorea marisflavi]|uniref:hypothetical protein n=1 Tax=Rossellomorea marisflavi TaxID=189381 RepID=UPI003458DD9A